MSFQMLPMAQQVGINMQRMDAGFGRIRDDDLHVRNPVDGGFRPAHGRFEALSPALIEPHVPMLVREPVIDYSHLLRPEPVMVIEPEEPVPFSFLRSDPTPLMPVGESAYDIFQRQQEEQRATFRVEPLVPVGSSFGDVDSLEEMRRRFNL